MADFISQIIKELQDSEPRDTEGLTTKQKQFLRLRVHTNTDREALRALTPPATWAQFLRWQDDEGFMSVYSEICPCTVADQVRDATQSLGMETIDIMAKAADGEELTKDERWFVERIHKVLGLEKVVVESTHTNIPPEFKLAQIMLSRGVPVHQLPPALRKLVEKYLPATDRLAALPPPTVSPSTGED